MPNKKQIPRVGTKLPQKPMPKQDKGGGIDPPPRALACGLEYDAAGRQMPPRRIPSLPYAGLQHAGNPRLG